MADLMIDCEEEGFDVQLLEKYVLTEVESDVDLCAELIFTDEAGIQKLNAETRGKDAVTDVLSYPNLQDARGGIRKDAYPYDLDEDGRLFLGSVVICRERAAQQAEEYGHSLDREIYYLAVHGFCHLLGYDHETEEDKRAMRAREEEILSKMNLRREE